MGGKPDRRGRCANGRSVVAGSATVSRADVEECLAFVAELVSKPGGVVYAPIFVRLEKELAALDESSGIVARARAVAESFNRTIRA